MRRRQSSNSVGMLSTSALDLFASALGAFILVSIILIPYFPNTAKTPAEMLEKLAEALSKITELTQENESQAEKITELSQLVETQATEISELSKTNESQTDIIAALEQQVNDAADREAKRIDLPDLDLVIAIDITGSMGDPITGLKKEVRQLVSVLEKLTPSLGIGVIAFGDEKYAKPIIELPISTIKVGSESFINLEQFINKLTPGMSDPNYDKNTEYPEAVGLALKKAVASKWRNIATKRMIVVITDSPGYKNEVSSIMANAKQFSSSSDTYSVSTVFVATHDRKDVDLNVATKLRLKANSIAASSFLKRLAEAGSGRAIDSGESMTSDLLHAILL